MKIGKVLKKWITARSHTYKWCRYQFSVSHSKRKQRHTTAEPLSEEIYTCRQSSSISWQSWCWPYTHVRILDLKPLIRDFQTSLVLHALFLWITSPITPWIVLHSIQLLKCLSTLAYFNDFFKFKSGPQ